MIKKLFLGAALTAALASCGSGTTPTPTAATTTTAQAQAATIKAQSNTSTAPGALQWYADRAILPSDSDFAWTWFNAPTLPADIAAMREGDPSELVDMGAYMPNAADFEDFVSESGYFLKNMRFYRDEVPCPNCHQFVYALVGELPDGTFGGFRASVFWDY